MFCFATAFATCLWRPSISVRLVSVVVTSSSLSSSHRGVGPKCKHSQPVSVECVYVNFVTVYEIGETLVKTSEQRALAFRFDLVTLGGLVDRSARDERNSLPLRRGPWSGESQLEPSALADYKFRTWKKKKKKKLLLSGECVWSFQLRNRFTFDKTQLRAFVLFDTSHVRFFFLSLPSKAYTCRIRASFVSFGIFWSLPIRF